MHLRRKTTCEASARGGFFQKDSYEEKSRIEEIIQQMLPAKTPSAVLRKLTNLMHPFLNQNKKMLNTFKEEHKENFQQISENPKEIQSFFEKLFSYQAKTTVSDFLQHIGTQLITSYAPITAVFLALLPQVASTININPGMPENGTDACKNFTETCIQGFLTSDVSNQSISNFTRTIVNNTGSAVDMTSPTFLNLNECSNLTNIGKIISEIYLKGTSQARSVVESISQAASGLSIHTNASQIPSDMAEQLKSALNSLCIEKGAKNSSNSSLILAVVYVPLGIIVCCALACVLGKSMEKKKNSNQNLITIKCCSR
jgi:hypothetical protein